MRAFVYFKNAVYFNENSFRNTLNSVTHCSARISYTFILYTHKFYYFWHTSSFPYMQSYTNIVCHNIIYIIHSHLRGVSAASNTHYCIYYNIIYMLTFVYFIAVFLSLFLCLAFLCVSSCEPQNTILQLTKYYNMLHDKNELYIIIIHYFFVSSSGCHDEYTLCHNYSK